MKLDTDRLWSVLHSGWFAFGGAVGAVVVVLILVTVPVVMIRLPADYFTGTRRMPASWRRLHPLATGLAIGLKNLAGVLFVMLGLVMLVTPGQGLLTILFGLMLCNYPGKYRSERWLITRPSIWRTVNWLRCRAGRPGLIHPTATREATFRKSRT